MSINQNEKSLATKLGLVARNNLQIIQSLQHDFLTSVYQPNATDEEQIKLNEKVKTTYKNWYGGDLDSSNKVLASLSIGEMSEKDLSENYRKAAKSVAKALDLNFIEKNLPVEHVSPTQFQIAAKEISEGLGLKFIDKIYPDTQLTKKDFVFFELDMNQFQENKELIKKLSNAAANVMVLTNFQAPSQQNQAICMLDEKRIQAIDLSNVAFGLVQNLNLDEKPTIYATLRKFVKTQFVDKDYQLTEKEKTDYNLTQDRIVESDIAKQNPSLMSKISQFRDRDNVDNNLNSKNKM